MPAARNRSVLSQGSRSYKSAKVAAKRLEEAALSYKGDERVQLLRRWLIVLKETQRATTVVREPQLRDNPDQTAPLLAKRDELLQFAQGAISEQKINADIARLDNEITQLQHQINSMDALHATSIVNQNKKAQTATEIQATMSMTKLSISYYYILNLMIQLNFPRLRLKSC
ncbi:hypothetical protein Zm00014a_036618 [Zea mays]|uniref:Uncharacterized protein n=1 Tax=Zea mays TaxID=4577 RepID=A0A3L6F2G5_MAIZE|nr:hypothetical protein Zm00014a_036618 [Zea mays]